MTTYILLVYIFILLLFSLFVTNNDFMFPATVVFIVYAFSVSLAIIEMKKWDVYISAETLSIFCAGLMIYLIVGIVTRGLAKPFRIKKECQYTNGNFHEVLEVSSVITVIVILLNIYVVLEMFKAVRTTALVAGAFSSVGEMIGNSRNAVVYGETSLKLTSTVRYLYHFQYATSYIYLYIEMLRIAKKKKEKALTVISHWLPIILFFLTTFIRGERMACLEIVTAGIFLFYYFFREQHGGNVKGFQGKFAVRVAGIVIIVLIAFSQIRGFVGRTNTYDLVDYIAQYAGAPIKLFDMFIQNPPSKNTSIWGAETFVNVWKYIGHKTGDATLNGLIMNKEFRSVNGFGLGNVYTAFREYMNDFGFIGLLVLTTIHSFFFTYYYTCIKKVNRHSFTSRIDFSVLLYAFLVPSLFFFSIDDRLFQAYLDIEKVKIVIWMYVVSKVVVCLNKENGRWIIKLHN